MSLGRRTRKSKIGKNFHLTGLESLEPRKQNKRERRRERERASCLFVRCYTLLTGISVCIWRVRNFLASCNLPVVDPAYNPDHEGDPQPRQWRCVMIRSIAMHTAAHHQSRLRPLRRSYIRRVGQYWVSAVSSIFRRL